MTVKDKTAWGRLRALYNKVTGLTPSPDRTVSRTGEASNDLPSRIGPYTITRKLGEGGMGVVYAAHDGRLDRAVALKTISPLAGGEPARTRFWREARAAARVNHPNICQIYEIGEDAGELFIAMELLEGLPLADQLQQGPMSIARALPVALEILGAVSALHASGIVHRDLKPSNVFLTRHGIKLLDFGLARPEPDATLGTRTELTRPGAVVGTPRYMAPEQVRGESVDERTDLFAVGAILFEMLAGRPAFGGTTVGDVLHATLHEQPPALTGSPAIAAVDRVIRAALAKRPADRPSSADDMAAQLRAAHSLDSGPSVAVAQPLTRIVVLPFRVLRPDPESDFLAYSLPDAISMSLSHIGSLVVRSSAIAARFADEKPDVKSIATEADVDRVLLGTLLRSGAQLRAAVQLVDASTGTLLASHVVQSSMRDLFELQDEIARRVVETVAPPLTGGPVTTRRDAPRDARAYELYLRANELARTYDGLGRARDLYERCLELDPEFAPAWAHLGRCHRVIGKYIDGTTDTQGDAERAFRRALAINPRLSVAHKYLAQLEAEIGKPAQAVVRLVEEASRHGNDPELFAGLVHACRYCGLFDEAMTAHAEARRLDPNVPTSIEQTLLVAGEIGRLLAVEAPVVAAGADEGIRAIGLGLTGRREEAKAILRSMQRASLIPAFQSWISYLTAWLDRRPAGMIVDAASRSLKIQEDPEAIFQEGWLLCDVGEYEAGLVHMRRGVEKGYFPVATLTTWHQFDPIRHLPAFQEILARAEEGRRQALAAFEAAGGARLLGR